MKTWMRVRLVIHERKDVEFARYSTVALISPRDAAEFAFRNNKAMGRLESIEVDDHGEMTFRYAVGVDGELHQLPTLGLSL